MEAIADKETQRVPPRSEPKVSQYVGEQDPRVPSTLSKHNVGRVYIERRKEPCGTDFTETDFFSVVMAAGSNPPSHLVLTFKLVPQGERKEHGLFEVKVNLCTVEELDTWLDRLTITKPRQIEFLGAKQPVALLLKHAIESHLLNAAHESAESTEAASQGRVSPAIREFLSRLGSTDLEVTWLRRKE